MLFMTELSNRKINKAYSANMLCIKGKAHDMNKLQQVAG